MYEVDKPSSDIYCHENAHHIIHVLNAADGKFNVNTGTSYYRDTTITMDWRHSTWPPLTSTPPSALQTALSSPNALAGKVLVHCAMGLSRPSSLVLA
ncbi:unnamed protein product [Coregonus sp. 'balchen']|nr:unnamed protein product [Coregonus sp. 'balchen']